MFRWMDQRWEDFQKQLLQGKIHIQKQCRVVGIHTVSLDKRINLSVELMFIDLKEKAEIQKILFLYCPGKVFIRSSFISFQDLSILFFVDPLALLHVLQRICHSRRCGRQLINMLRLPLGQTFHFSFSLPQ